MSKIKKKKLKQNFVNFSVQFLVFFLHYHNKFYYFFYYNNM